MPRPLSFRVIIRRDVRRERGNRVDIDGVELGPRKRRRRN